MPPSRALVPWQWNLEITLFQFHVNSSTTLWLSLLLFVCFLSPFCLVLWLYQDAGTLDISVKSKNPYVPDRSHILLLLFLPFINLCKNLCVAHFRDQEMPSVALSPFWGTPNLVSTTTSWSQQNNQLLKATGIFSLLPVATDLMHFFDIPKQKSGWSSELWIIQSSGTQINKAKSGNFHLSWLSTCSYLPS